MGDKTKIHVALGLWVLAMVFIVVLLINVIQLNEKFEDVGYVYLVDANTGKNLVDPNTGYPLRLHIGNNLQGLIAVVNNQQQALQDNKSNIELNSQRIDGIINFLNQVQEGVVEGEN